MGPPESTHRHPWFLPDGHHFLYYVAPTGTMQLGSLDEPGLKRDILKADSRAAVAANHLFFVRNGTLFRQPFDATRMTLSGEPIVVGVNVGFLSANGRAAFAASSDALSFRSGGNAGPLVWRNRSGTILAEAAPAADYQGFALSPDNTRLAAHRHTALGGDIWETDLDRGGSTRVTTDESLHYGSPAWSSDGHLFAYASAATRTVFIRDGTSEVFRFQTNIPEVPELAWAPRSDRLLFTVTEPKTRTDIWAVPLDGGRKPYPVIASAFNERSPQVSPDGKWLAYVSDRAGAAEVFVTPFPAISDRPRQVSNGGGLFPTWHGVGELFFQSPDGWLNSVQVDTSRGTFDASRPIRLFETGTLLTNVSSYAPSADGMRFLTRGATAGGLQNLMLTLNWTAATPH